ncbi:flagellar motor switch protein FliN [Gemmatimonas sp.]|jgi:flagellar motor switch protein FliN/FliY|uniref:flagellar motor switch protein FliN n=1 Tax=Gemmatimonas sp. TaxID=1962908 RepID=UPI0031C0C8AA|nr:flagellar motor switch protein FliN [Gemmatimonas sp.]
MNPAEIDALVASAQAAKAAGQPVSSLMEEAGAALAAAPAVRAPQLTDFEQTMLGNTEVPIGMLLDLTLPVSIELGRTSMMVQELLRLGRGSVIQLDRLAGEPIEIYVGDRRFAEGEVVVLGEHFGVRITRVLANPGAAGSANAA